MTIGVFIVLMTLVIPILGMGLVAINGMWNDIIRDLFQ